jgi:methionine sulfoxide reductase heme-binding subunit
MSSTALWYLTRGSGVVSLILLTCAVVLGLLTATRWSRARWPRFVVESLHRNISLLSTVFLAVHIASSVVDKYVSITWLNAFVPFGASYKPLWLGLGALSLDLLLAVAVTSLIRVRLGYGAWRAVHWLSYACFVIAVAHGLGIGSDRHQSWFLAINLAAVGSVGAALMWRVYGALRTVPRSAAMWTAPPAGPGPSTRPVTTPSPATPSPATPSPATPSPTTQRLPEGALR